VNNDPVNWVDLWGLRPLTPEERAAYIQATGHSIDFDKIDVREGEMPAVHDIRDAANSVGADHSKYSDAEIQQAINRPGIDAISLPDGRIYTVMDPISIDLASHEINHQDTYQNGATITYGGVTTQLNSAKEVFEELAKEAFMPGAYNIPGTLEWQANQVQQNVHQNNTQQNVNPQNMQNTITQTSKGR
jgi:hypothetical protein